MTDWSQAACRAPGVDPEWFFPNETGQRAVKSYVEAQKVCWTCPLQYECLELAVNAEARHQSYGATSMKYAGVFGGWMPEHRWRFLVRPMREALPPELKMTTLRGAMGHDPRFGSGEILPLDVDLSGMPTVQELLDRLDAEKRGPMWCTHGHRMTPENTKVTSKGSRRCVECDERRARNEPTPPVAGPDTCDAGHPRTEENGKWQRRFYRGKPTDELHWQCRLCKNLRDQEHRRKAFL